MQNHPFFDTVDWRHPGDLSISVLLVLGGLLLIFLTGPLLLIAYGIQRWAAASTWDWKDRWASVRGMAVFCGLLLAIVCGLLVVPMPFFRLAIHTLWLRIPLLGDCSLWPIRFSNMNARWIMLIPFAPALALIFERIYPQTHALLTRILLPHEIAQMQRQQQAKTKPAITSTPPPSKSDKNTTLLPSTPRPASPPAVHTHPHTTVPQQQRIFLSADSNMPSEELPPPIEAAPADTPKEPLPTMPEHPQLPEKPKIDWNAVEE